MMKIIPLRLHGSLRVLDKPPILHKEDLDLRL